MADISIIVPVFNEENNISTLVERINKHFKEYKAKFELIFIDDHSTDSSVKIIKKLSKTYPISVFSKIGSRGKAFSIIEGVRKAKGKYIVMIDADLQYPPEAILPMVEKVKNGADIVVANRSKVHTSKIRKIGSDIFKYLFGKVLFGLNYDIQAGLKVFKKELIEILEIKPKTGWTFDLELLHKAKNAGYIIKSYNIVFEKRKNGNSKISFLKSSVEIASNALSIRLKPIKPVHIKPNSKISMIGAGIKHKGKSYITHTTLDYKNSAIQTFIPKQKFLIGFILVIFILGVILKPLLTLQLVIGILSFIYFADVCFNLYLILKSLHIPQEILITEDQLSKLKDADLPIYSILCPLYKEAHIIPQFLNSINRIDYPKEKLDVMLLLEEDDKSSIEKVNKMKLPSYVRMLVVPHSMPKTKPKACNYGLSKAKGEYLVIYDAEDMPDPLQLKKAFLAFKRVANNVFCLQAKLNYYNPTQNLLTRFFTAEYSLWFDITLTGLQSINTSIPLGGTSNHFKTANLKKLQGWDPFNVTEDADLGIRLFKMGYKTAIIDSVTLEEANSKWGNWLRQRSRWIKGYMQTYLVHTRDNVEFIKKTGWHSLIFQLVVGGKISFILINPILWIVTIAYFTLYRFVGPTIESLYPAYVFYMAAFSLVFGNFLFLYYYMIGCAKREQWNLIKYVFLIPIYWLMISIAGGIALFELIFKPHYWQKTIHGLHFKNEDKKLISSEVLKLSNVNINFPRKVVERLKKIIQGRKLAAGGLFIFANAIASIFTLLFSVYLGRKLNFADFSLVSLINGLIAIVALVYGALGTTMNYQISYLVGKVGEKAAVEFWAQIRRIAFFISCGIGILWLIATPFLIRFFRLESLFPLVLFTPILLVDLMASADKGVLFSKLNFKILSLLTILEPLLRFIFAVVIISFDFDGITYIAIPLAAVITFLVGWFFAFRYRKELVKPLKTYSFPIKFFFISLISGLSVIIFLNFDVVLAKHYLPSTQAGIYALTSTIGKMFFFLASLAAPFTVPLVSRNEGANKDSKKFLQLTILGVILVTIPPFILVSVFSHEIIPFVFGAKANATILYLPLVSFSLICFSIARVYADYYLVKKYYSFNVIPFVLGGLTLLLLKLFHSTLVSFIYVMSAVWLANLAIVLAMHKFNEEVRIIERNVIDFIELFISRKYLKSEKNFNGLRILIFNWRDTKHKWAGGAEKYIYELSKRWIKDGNQVTIFCGNDSLHARNENIDGINIIRRGGFYTVYLWAFLYYIFKLQGKFDVIIDSENGIPFFTPLYARVPVYLLIHHVHQDVHRKQLKFPLSQIALFLEGKFMPFVYKNKTVLTVSESSKIQTLKLGFTDKNKITIIHPGINNINFKKIKKTKNPTLLYLGRLKPYKNIETAVKAFAQILNKYPNAQFIIAGDGESKEKIKKLASELNVATNVKLYGTVSEEEKEKLYKTSWLCIQPSLIEGWGITVIEANSFGTPVIASNVNGLKDSVIDGKTGFLVESKSATEFANVIDKCFSNSKLLKKLGKSAKEWSKNFLWETSANIFYKELIESEKKHNYLINFNFLNR